MKKLFAALAFAASSACAAPAPEETAMDPAAVQVMVLGSFHMGNPGLDVANAQVDNMLTETRQAEIASAVAALATFKPTVIAVERITKEPDYIDPKYADLTPEQIETTADERYQFGYRLARIEGVTRVYGIDEQPGDGEPDYFPFDKLTAHVEATGQGERFEQQIASLQAMMADFTARQKDHTVAELLIRENNAEETQQNAKFYYEMSEYDRGEAQPGAELQAYWFMRNAKIFSKLMQVTKPGDRVVVVYGSGHKYWLEHFADHTPGFVSVDPVPYLEKAAAE